MTDRHELDDAIEVLEWALWTLWADRFLGVDPVGSRGWRTIRDGCLSRIRAIRILRAVREGHVLVSKSDICWGVLGPMRKMHDGPAHIDPTCPECGHDDAEGCELC